MFEAFDRDSPGAVSFWLRSGADVTAKNRGGKTALELAVSFRWHAVVRQLLDHGADCRVTSSETGETLLHQIVREDSDAALARLVVRCSDVNAVDRIKQRTALHEAALAGRFDIIKVLVDEGDADLEVRDEEGFHAVHLSVRHEVILSYLIVKGADITAQSNTGKMPIHLAVIENQVPSVRTLLRVGEALVFVPDKYGKSALDYAHQIDRTFAVLGTRAHYDEMLKLLDRYSLG